MKKTLSMFFLAIFVILLSACDNNEKWINYYDKKKDEAALKEACEWVDCGVWPYEVNGREVFIYCGDCDTGLICIENSCEDIDECEKDNGGCEHKCQNKYGGRECYCETGYVLNEDGVSCDEIEYSDTDSGDTGDDGNSGNTGDTGNSGNSGNTGDADNDIAVLDDDSIEDSDIISDEDVISSPFCGNNVVEDGEDCDDGNKLNTDGCKNDCTYNICGDTYVHAGVEICDSNFASCSSIGLGSSGTAECSNDCKSWLTSGKCRQTVDCSGNPENSSWNTALSIAQTWDGSAWVPSTTGTYSSTASTTECRFKCNSDFIWDGSECVATTRPDQPCTGLPLNAEWNTASSITQTWNGSDWAPSTAGSYNETSSVDSCRFVCLENYTWNSGSSTCVADTKVSNCAGLPENATWNEASSITQTWNGSDWMPSTTGTHNLTSSTTECRFRCNSNYSWNSISSTCVADTQTANCPVKPATGTDWNDSGKNGTYTQTWSGTAWAPVNTTTYNTTAGDCRYICATNYTWNSGSSTCVANTQTANCPAKPTTGTVWNDSGKNGTYTQTWNGSAWAPVNTTTYNTTAGECRYICGTNYTWNSGSSTCVADTKTFNCAAKPSTGTVWNTVSSYTQTWNGSVWIPVDSTTAYNATASNTSCRYKCATNYTWNSGLSTCVANTKIFTCADKPETDTVWNTVSSYTQTWNGSAWSPADSVTTYHTTESTTSCRFKCNNSYWNGTICVAASITGALCTGQTKCSNETVEIICPTEGSAFYGQDVQYVSKCKPKSYTLSGTSGSDIVTDNNTGLIWQRTVFSTTYTWQQAIDYCDGLIYAGQTDWRLPAIEELTTLPDYGRYFPSIDLTIFPNTNTSHYWSNSTVSSSTDKAWVIQFYNGANVFTDKTDKKYARCVKGAALPASSFAESTVSGKVVVTDTLTNLVWQREFSGTPLTWVNALSYCETLTYAGYSDWRLPNIEEIKTLIDYTKNNPASIFSGMVSEYFWSSSPHVDNESSAWRVNFSNGSTGNNDKIDSYYARCVR